MSKRKLFKFYYSYYEVAKELSEKDRLEFLWAIMQRQFEGIEPNLKGIAKIAYVGQKHSIDAQIKGWEDKMGEELNPTQPPSAPPMQGASVPPTLQEEVKEEVKVKEKEEVKGALPEVFNFKKSFIELGVETQYLEDWLKVRKAKRGSNTKTAFDSFVAEVSKTDLTINEAVKLCAQKSWVGFDSDWIKPKQPHQQSIFPQEKPFDPNRMMPAWELEAMLRSGKLNTNT